MREEGALVVDPEDFELLEREFSPEELSPPPPFECSGCGEFFPWRPAVRIENEHGEDEEYCSKCSEEGKGERDEEKWEGMAGWVLEQGPYAPLTVSFLQDAQLHLLQAKGDGDLHLCPGGPLRAFILIGFAIQELYSEALRGRK